jgi:hypothetical protein
MSICDVGTGTAVLSAPDLLDLDIDCVDGFVLVDLQVGFPAERPVVRARALADGFIDQSTFLGQRAITVTVRLDQRVSNSQALIDRLMPFLSPRRRVFLTWSLPGSPSELRQIEMRGVDAPLIIAQPKFYTVVCQFVSTGPFLTSADETCETVDPLGLPEEIGREYDLEFDREYIPNPPVGGFFALNNGTAPAHWRATIRAQATDPVLTVRDSQLDFSQGGGITLFTGQTLVIDTLDRTILLNDDPTESRYDRVNFEDWSWDDLLMRPGLNLFRLQGTNFNFTSQLEVCWRDTYI